MFTPKTLPQSPRNWRTHPTEQADALRGVLAQVGWADAVLARETPDGLQLIDGHLRAEVADDQLVPVLVLDVDEHEADLLLATLDPLAAMALAALPDDPAWESRSDTSIIFVEDGETQTRPRSLKSFGQALNETDCDWQKQEAQERGK